MTKFIIKAKDFKNLLDGVSCKGTLQFKAKGKTESPLFSAFFIDVDKETQKISIRTIDTFFNSIKQHAEINAKVEEEGIIEITDKKKYDKIFKGIDLEKPISVSSDGNFIIIENEDGDWYRRRIVGDKALDDVNKSMENIFDWINSHDMVEFDAENDKGEIEKRKVWRFSTPVGSALYPMRIKTTKKNLSKFVSDAVDLTKDNDTIVICKDGVITIHTGKPNSTDQSKHKLAYADIGKEIFDFAVKFSALQAIVPNLQEEVILNFRMTKSKTIVLRIESSNKTFHQIISIGSQDKDGVLYDDEEQE